MSSNPILFACLLSGVAGLAFFIALRNVRRAKRSRSWPTVDATILDAHVVMASKGSRPKITYRYQIAGAHYESDRIVVGGMWGTSGDGSARLVQRFPKGSLAPVAVDPASPGYSVLVPGVKVHQVLTASFCAVAFIATLPVLWAFLFLVPGGT